ncbi:hypothetical protein CFF91_17890 [Salmonella enterica]|nr:hypothetical protein [Salmonella enterica]EDC7491796.1 hypothetical protein [Salmonella enterica]
MPGYYRIPPGWEKRRRRQDDDVLLEATVTVDKTIQIQVENTFIRWLKTREKGAVSLDNKKITCWYCGGVWLHYTVNTNVMSLYLHSGGEDAFDSLADCANEIARLLYQNHSDVSIKWTEHPHRRKYLKDTTGT